MKWVIDVNARIYNPLLRGADPGGPNVIKMLVSGHGVNPLGR